MKQSIRTAKPYVHQSELQNIDSSEGGEMELNIETSTSDKETYTAEWTFNGIPIDSEKLDAYPRIEGNTVYLLVPKVSKTLHEGRFECTLTWPSGMQAIFPFAVVVHEPEADVAPTNEVSKLRLKTVEVSKVRIADEDEIGVDFRESVIMGEWKNDVSMEGTSKVIMLESAEFPKYYRTSKASILSIQHEPLKVLQSMEKTEVNQQSINSSVVPTNLVDSKISTKPLIQEYLEPTKLCSVEGEAFKISISGKFEANSQISWTLNGRKISNGVFDIRRRSSAVVLAKSTVLKSDSGEYTLWIDGKVEANFILYVETKKVEEPLEENLSLTTERNDVNVEKAEESINDVETASASLSEKSKKTEIEESPKVEAVLMDADQQATPIRLLEGDNFSLNTVISLDARQLKADKLWWAKNGKPFVDVDGVPLRGAEFTSKSTKKSPTSTNIEIIKKTPVTVGDAATYTLVGEPRIKRGFKSQETTYATFIVSIDEMPKEVVNSPEEDDTTAPVVEEVAEKPEEPSEKSVVEEAKPKKKKSKDESGEEKPKKKKKKSIDEGGEEKPRKKKKSIEAEPKPLIEAPDMKDSTGNDVTADLQKQSKVEEGVENLKSPKEVDEEIKKALGNRAEKPVEVEDEQTKMPESLKKEESPKEEQALMSGTNETVVKLMEGDRFRLTAKIPLDSRQMKSDRLWWTKNGKPLIDVDGITSRNAKLTSRSTPNPPRSTDVELTKKDPVSLEDSATYRLMGEPRIKRGFKSQETTYATFVVSVAEKPIDNSSQPPSTEEAHPKEELKKLPPENLEKMEISSVNSANEVNKLERKKSNDLTTLAEPKSPEVKDEIEVSTKKEAEEKPPVEEKKEEQMLSAITINFTEGDKFLLSTVIPLEAKQLKTDKLWWMKNGKLLVEVNDIASRTAKYASKAMNKSLKSTNVELNKKEPVELDDAATYVLMGEPRIKRGFKQEGTTYATIVISVIEKPKEGADRLENNLGITAPVEVAVEDKEKVPKVVEPPDEVKADEAKPEKKKSRDESVEEKPKKKKKEPVDNEIKTMLAESPKEDAKPTSEEPSKEEPLTTSANIVNLTTGDKMQLKTLVPLDTRQLKNEKLWWTKNGKVFVDVDGLTPRSAVFNSKTTPKPPSSTEVELIKKDPVAVEDTATYVLVGEPKIKRGFKSQETTYATIVVKVTDKPAEISEEPKEATTEILPSKEPEAVVHQPLPEAKEETEGKNEVQPLENGTQELPEKPAGPVDEIKKDKKKKKAKSREGENEEGKKKSKRKKKETSIEDVDRVDEEKPLESKPIEVVELRCIEANANKRLGNNKIPIPAGEPLCLTVTGIPPEVASVEWTLNGQPIRTGKRIQRLLEPNPLGKRYDGELMAQLYLDSTVLLDSGDYELTISKLRFHPKILFQLVLTLNSVHFSI